MVVCFNVVIMDTRKKPILTMLEEIILYMMERLYNSKEEGHKCNTQVCLTTIKKMDEFGEGLK